MLETTHLDKVSVRIPSFWPEDPKLWFAQIEAQFAISGITADATKFFYVTSQLECRYAKEVKDVIENPPEVGKFEKLKTELIKRLSMSAEKRVKQLLNDEQLGDRKPSQFLRHLQTLAGPTVNNDFLKTIWADRLPTTIQAIIVSQKAMDIGELAELADRVHEIAPPTQIAAVVRPSGSSDVDLAQQIAELTREVASLKSQFHSERVRQVHRKGNGKKRSNSRRRSSSRSRQSGVCWYHNRFGDKSTKCTKPCTYTAENWQGSRH